MVLVEVLMHQACEAGGRTGSMRPRSTPDELLAGEGALDCKVERGACVEWWQQWLKHGHALETRRRSKLAG